MDERDERRTMREAALVRSARVKRWVAGGALALTGIFSAIAAAVLPASHASSPSSSSTPAPAQAAAPSTEEDAGDDQRSALPNISPPAAVPQPSGSGSGAVSGGS